MTEYERALRHVRGMVIAAQVDDGCDDGIYEQLERIIAYLDEALGEPDKEE